MFSSPSVTLSYPLTLDTGPPRSNLARMGIAEEQFSLSRGTAESKCLSICTTGRLGVVILAFTLSLSSCRTPPDMRPFADATSQLAGSIKTTGRTIVSEVDSMSAKWKGDQRKGATNIAEKFNREWAQRNALADAILEYSASLTSIAQAGEQGEKSALAIADSFKKLCSAIEIAMPPAAAVEAAVNIGAQLYGRFARDYAAKTLGAGMRQLQPSIDETAKELGNSLQQVEIAFDAIREQNAQNIEDEDLNGTKVRTERNNLTVLSDRRAALLRMLSAGTKSRDDLRSELLKSSDQAKEKEFARLAALNTDITSELTALESSIKAESERLAPIDARKAADRDRLTTQITLVRTIHAGLGDWAAAHSRLAAAALEKKPLQVDDLVQTALEIRDLVKTVRTARKE
jgi:uncharacterized protein YukE